MYTYTGAAAKADPTPGADDIYKARLAELDIAIADLLDGEPVRDTESLRRTESDRRGSGRLELASRSTGNPHPIRRTRSERRNASSGSIRHYRHL